MRMLDRQHRATYIQALAYQYKSEVLKPIVSNAVDFNKRFDEIQNQIDEVGFNEFIYGKHWRHDIDLTFKIKENSLLGQPSTPYTVYSEDS